MQSMDGSESRTVLSVVENAKRLYEEIRERVSKEVQIACVQDRVKAKLLGREYKEIDFVFYKEIEQEDTKNSSVVASESEEEESSSLAELIEEEKTILKAPKQKEGYIDLEADFSGEEENESNDFSELEDFIDAECENNAEFAMDKFVDEQNERNLKEIATLKNKFGKRKKRKLELPAENAADFEFSEEEFSEHSSIELSADGEKEDEIECTPVSFRTEAFEVQTTSSLFNVNSGAVDKLKKKEGQHFVFKENE
ncbi:hypothetical protein ENBRE01_1060 [Enteropsectra breve]|nr:hypothetical protein ENBRE01_1060 [Enteropsectra breve]